MHKAAPSFIPSICPDVWELSGAQPARELSSGTASGPGWPREAAGDAGQAAGLAGVADAEATLSPVRATLAPRLDMQQDPSDHKDRTHTRQRWSRMMKGHVSLGTLELLHQP